jgi:uncharacterized damage-inducible protein DinB
MKAEVWLRGPLPQIPDLLQPVAHALFQAREELELMMIGFPEKKLWNKCYEMASPAFHLQHLAGVLDRLFTYAKEENLSEEQLTYLKKEGIENSEIKVQILLQNFSNQIDKAIDQLKETTNYTLTKTRYIGRLKIPTTQIGLFVHAAEHTMRHIGQLLVTINVLKHN